MTNHLDLSSLRAAIKVLQETMEMMADHTWVSAQRMVVQHALVAGAIQNFEVAYEMCVKTLRRHLEMSVDVPDTVDKLDFRDLLRVAAEKGLIDDVERWFDYRKMRNITAHSYDFEKAQMVYVGIAQFMMDANQLLAALAFPLSGSKNV